jgi:hypothetical protein
MDVDARRTGSDARTQSAERGSVSGRRHSGLEEVSRTTIRHPKPTARRAGAARLIAGVVILATVGAPMPACRGIDDSA